MSQFAQYQQQLNALPVMPAPQRRGLFGGLRNFAQQAQQPGGFVDRLQMFGASMQDIGQMDGVNRAGRLSEMRAAPGLAAAEAAMQQERLSFQRNADRRAEEEARALQFYNTRAGVVGVGPDGTSNVVFANPEDPEEAFGGVPVGMIRNEDGSLAWAPGYVDSQLELGRGRRRTILDNPTPSRARASGGGGSRSTSASAPRQAPRSNPWDRDY